MIVRLNQRNYIRDKTLPKAGCEHVLCRSLKLECRPVAGNRKKDRNNNLVYPKDQTSGFTMRICEAVPCSQHAPQGYMLSEKSLFVHRFGQHPSDILSKRDNAHQSRLPCFHNAQATKLRQPEGQDRWNEESCYGTGIYIALFNVRYWRNRKNEAFRLYPWVATRVLYAKFSDFGSQKIARRFHLLMSIDDDNHVDMLIIRTR